MDKNLQIQLQATSILKVPINSYDQNFSFIVNGEEFKTSRLFSDLVSPKISEYHKNDPTMSEFIINTKYSGNFSNILKLCSFQLITIPSNEISFCMEVFQILGNDSIYINKSEQSTEINTDNVISLLQEHFKFHNLINKKLKTKSTLSHQTSLIYARTSEIR